MIGLTTTAKHFDVGLGFTPHRNFAVAYLPPLFFVLGYSWYKKLLDPNQRIEEGAVKYVVRQKWPGSLVVCARNESFSICVPPVFR
jgi:hypothetical protein